MLQLQITIISIHAPPVGSDLLVAPCQFSRLISIHAPPVGSDIPGVDELTQLVISIHAPPAGSDRNHRIPWLFLSISIHAPPAGSDTARAVGRLTSSRFQSTLPLWGATRLKKLEFVRQIVFQSTLPLWGATRRSGDDNRQNMISIHAPPVGSDFWDWWRPSKRK